MDGQPGVVVWWLVVMAMFLHGFGDGTSNVLRRLGVRTLD
jgi:hypothetical protein